MAVKSKTFLPTIAVFLFFLFFLYKKTVITLARSILAVDKAHSLVSVFSVLKGLLQKSVKLVKSHSDRSLRFITLVGNKVSWIWAEIGVESCFNRKRTHQTTIIMKRDISTIFITPTLAFEACTCHT